MAFVDLHTHTTASDGTEPPASNVRLAREAGLAAVAITDHDTVAGLAEASEAGRRLGVEVVPGVEISTVADGQDIHVLGYYLDTDNAELLSSLAELRRVRDLRNEMMVDKLRSLGLTITMDEVLASLSKPLGEGETVGRPHIAELLVKRGYVSSMAEAFDRYLGKNGAAYVNPPRIRPEEAIAMIHRAGGAAVLAHPGLYGDDKLVEKLAREGLDGIEAYHADHTPEDARRYRDLAERHGLIITAGSDYHGSRNGKVFHAPIGSRRVDIGVLAQLRKAAERRSNR